MTAEPDRGRELAARILGISVAALAAATAWQAIQWPAPAIAFALGFVAYQIARPKES